MTARLAHSYAPAQQRTRPRPRRSQRQRRRDDDAVGGEGSVCASDALRAQRLAEHGTGPMNAVSCKLQR